jgi:CTP synthase
MNSIKNKEKKYVFVTGGVISSLGKGITASTIGSLLELRGFKVSFQKMDPYLNVDAGTMSPYQHGEVFVTDDGAETDLDIGNYERFTDAILDRKSSVTTGQIYQSVIKKEREGVFIGQTVQVIPHITDEIKSRIYKASNAHDCNILIVEIGGTVGDIESFPFLEAIRQFRHEVGALNSLFIHVTMVPLVGGKNGELKTKPTQHSVRELRAIGIQPDILVCRTALKLSDESKNKIAMFCDVDKNNVINALDYTKSLYEVPLLYHEEKLDDIILEKLELQSPVALDLSKWSKIVDIINNPKGEVHIAVIGKYMQFDDTYKSLYEAIEHAAIDNILTVHVDKIEADEFPLENLSMYDGVIIPGGFGVRGTQAMINVIQAVREKKIPLLGICYGMQMMCIEYARNIALLENASSQEMSATTQYPIISVMEKQKKEHNLGGTMRLGAYPTKLMKGTLIHSLYNADIISERHRHRFEFNNEYLDILKEKGLIFSGFYDDFLVETIELPSHPWAIGVQFHPELKSKPYKAHPLFGGFIKACFSQKK